MITTSSIFQRFSSPLAPAMIARSLFGIDAAISGSRLAQATEPDPAEPLDPDATNSATQADGDPDTPEDPVTGENDDQEPAPR